MDLASCSSRSSNGFKIRQAQFQDKALAVEVEGPEPQLSPGARERGQLFQPRQDVRLERWGLLTLVALIFTGILEKS